MRLEKVADTNSSPIWQKLWGTDEIQHPYYTQAELETAAEHFQPVYYLPPDQQYSHDPVELVERDPYNLVVCDETGPVMGLILTVDRYRSGTRLSAFGRPIFTVQCRSATADQLYSAAKLLHKEIKSLQVKYQADRYHIRDFLRGERLSPLSEIILRQGGSAYPFYTQIVDLNASPEAIGRTLRENIHRVIRKRQNDLTVKYVGSAEVSRDHRDILQDLHARMRGKVVRPARYWDAVLRCVQQDHGFFIFGMKDSKYVAGAYFARSEIYCYYAVAAHDPAYTEGGISHVLLWEAILAAKDQGCRYFEVGDRVYTGVHPWVDNKLQSISHFKSGFGSAASLRMDIFSGFND